MVLRDSGNLPWKQKHTPPALQHLGDSCQSLAVKSFAASQAHWNSRSKAVALSGQQYIGTQQLHPLASRLLATCATAHAGHISTAHVEHTPLDDKVRSSTCH